MIHAFPQNLWRNIANSSNPKSVEFFNNEAWIVTDAGITVKNILTGENKYLNKLNSSLPSSQIIGLQVKNDKIWIATANDGIVEIVNNK